MRTLINYYGTMMRLRKVIEPMFTVGDLMIVVLGVCCVKEAFQPPSTIISLDSLRVKISLYVP